MAYMRSLLLLFNRTEELSKRKDVLAKKPYLVLLAGTHFRPNKGKKKYGTSRAWDTYKLFPFFVSIPSLKTCKLLRQMHLIKEFVLLLIVLDC